MLTPRKTMAKYTYCCNKCEAVYDISHSMSEIHDVCRNCGESGTLNKIPTSFNYSKAHVLKDSPGSVVKDVIENTKEEITQTKRGLKGRTHEC